MSLPVTTQALQQAFTILFGPHAGFSIDLIDQLDPDEIKAAFRKRALETHPDRSKTLGLVESVMTERFKDVAFAYDILNSALKNPIPKGRTDTVYASSVKASPRKSTPNDHVRDHFYRGSLPKHRLLIGQYLYYCGIISWNTLIKAIVWQKKQRPIIGQIAKEWGILSAKDINQILAERHTEREFRVKFAEYAWQKGYISTFERMALLGKQRMMQSPIGTYFIEQGLLYPEDINLAMEELKLHNQKAFQLGKK